MATDSDSSIREMRLKCEQLSREADSAREKADNLEEDAQKAEAQMFATNVVPALQLLEETMSYLGRANPRNTTRYSWPVRLVWDDLVVSVKILDDKLKVALSMPSGTKTISQDVASAWCEKPEDTVSSLAQALAERDDMWRSQMRFWRATQARLEAGVIYANHSDKPSE